MRESVGQRSLMPTFRTRYCRPSVIGVLVFTTLAAVVFSAPGAAFPGKKSSWFGFERFDFEVDGKPVLVVAPKIVAPGRPWVWHGEFFGHKPNPDLMLLG